MTSHQSNLTELSSISCQNSPMHSRALMHMHSNLTMNMIVRLTVPTLHTQVKTAPSTQYGWPATSTFYVVTRFLFVWHQVQLNEHLTSANMLMHGATYSIACLRYTHPTCSLTSLNLPLPLPSPALIVSTHLLQHGCSHSSRRMPQCFQHPMSYMRRASPIMPL